MTTLTVYGQDGQRQATHHEYATISGILKDIGVQLECWEANQPLAEDAEQDAVMAAYKDSIDALSRKYQFQSVDVVALRPDNPKKAEMRQKFLAEHTHGDFEIRFFVDGSGLFCLHVDDKVYFVLCEKGDLISVP
ncbi:MAG: cupin, partial [Gammaproteobacteria bacterium]